MFWSSSGQGSSARKLRQTCSLSDPTTHWLLLKPAVRRCRVFTGTQRPHKVWTHAQLMNGDTGGPLPVSCG